MNHYHTFNKLLFSFFLMLQTGLLFPMDENNNDSDEEEIAELTRSASSMSVSDSDKERARTASSCKSATKMFSSCSENLEEDDSNDEYSPGHASPVDLEKELNSENATPKKIPALKPMQEEHITTPKQSAITATTTAQKEGGKTTTPRKISFKESTRVPSQINRDFQLERDKEQRHKSRTATLEKKRNTMSDSD